MPEYAKKWLDAMEKRGWNLMSDVTLSTTPILDRERPDRVRYFMYADWKGRMHDIEIPVTSEKMLAVLVEKYGAR